MKIFKDLKYRLGFIGIVGFIIVFTITAIAIYAMKQTIVLQSHVDSHRIVSDFKKNIRETIKDVNFLKNIDFDQNMSQIIDDFKKIAVTIYENEPMINGIGLIRQYKVEEKEAVLESLRQAHASDITIQPITEKIKTAAKSKNTAYEAVIVYRYPKMPKSLIGLELTSNITRYNVLYYLNTFHGFGLTAPLDFINISGYNAVMYVPISQKIGDLYRWVVTIPFNYKNFLESFLSVYDRSKYQITLYDTEFNADMPIYRNSVERSFENTPVLQDYLEIGGRKFLLSIQTEEIYTLKNFWQPVLGFISGIAFVIFLLYYIYFKEIKEAEVNELQLKFLKAEELASIGHFTWNIKEDKILLSNQITKLFAFDANIICFEELKTKIHKGDLSFIDTTMEKTFSGEADIENSIEFRIDISGEGIKWILSNYTLHYDKDGELEKIFGTMQDITDRKNRELELNKKSEMLHLMAMTDQLTKIYNKAFFQEHLSKAISAHRRYNKVFSLILFDIDHFKEVNDQHGHLQGDHVLSEMAALVKNHTRSSDIFCRWGGEEFVIIADALQAHQAKELAEKLRKKIAEYEFIKNRTITSSFGVTEAMHDDTQKEIMKRVDRALYEAKESGRNRVAVI